jgi:copper chaperone NosL
MRRFIIKWSGFLAGLLLLGACGTAEEPKPVAIEAQDVCGFCKMAISEKRYAAEFIDQDGVAFKFDDIACMFHYVKDQQKKGSITAFFVVDFKSQAWLKAEEVRYVRSPEFKTPMSGGIAAFKEKSGADDPAVQYHGKLLSFSELNNLKE